MYHYDSVFKNLILEYCRYPTKQTEPKSFHILVKFLVLKLKHVTAYRPYMQNTIVFWCG